jgi:hypothetical protein
MPETNNFYDHPIFNPLTFRVETQQIQQLRETITRWLWTGATGGYIQGYSRIGKTSAFEMIKETLKFRSGKSIPTYFFSIPKRDKPTINTIFKNCCHSAQLKVNNRDSAEELKTAFAHYLFEKANSNHANQIVLMVDEMQRLKAHQFDAFAELYDFLRLMGISLIVIFIGNTFESDSLIEQVKVPQYDHIRGRFFSQKSTFSGIQNVSELAYCLKQYDERRFPVGTGPTYTEYFLPDEFKNGWRFEKLSNELWEVFREYQKRFKLPSWGMQYFTSTANILLIDYLPKTGTEVSLKKVIQECIELSGLASSHIDLSVA